MRDTKQGYANNFSINGITEACTLVSHGTGKELVTRRRGKMQVTWKKGLLPRDDKKYLVCWNGRFYIMVHSTCKPSFYYSAGDSMWEEHEVGELFYSELSEIPKEGE